MKKVISTVLALSMAAMLMVGLTGCGGDNSAEEKVELVSKTVNGMTLKITDELSEFAETNGVMKAMNEDGTASIGITAVLDAGGGSPEAYTEETYQASQMTSYSDVKFIELNNKATLDGVPAVYAHATGTNPSGVKLEMYNYIAFFEDGNYQSIVIAFAEGSNTFLQANIQTVIDSIKLSK